MILPGLRKIRVLNTLVRNQAAVLGQLKDASNWQMLKSDARTSVFAAKVVMDDQKDEKRAVIIKTHALTKHKDKLAAAFNTTRLTRQARGALVLQSNKEPSPTTHIHLRGRDNSGQLIETLVIEQLPGKMLIDEIAAADGVKLHTLAQATGELTGRLVRKGVFNRDHKPSNIIVEWKNNQPALTLIDTVGVQRSRRKDALPRMLKNLAVELLGTKTMPPGSAPLRAFVAAATHACEGKAERKALLNEVLRRIEVHGDPTPKDEIHTPANTQ